MVKIIKAQKINKKINTELLSKFGEFVYHSEGVEGIVIQVEFSNGTGIRFRRSHEDDDIEEENKRHKEDAGRKD